MKRMDEAERIEKSYEKYEETYNKSPYLSSYHSSVFIYQQREKSVLKSLYNAGFRSLRGNKILDVGCGIGSVMRDFVKYGVNPENCFGIDILQSRVKLAKNLSPNMNLTCGNAEKLPYDNNFFDIVLCFTLFTSIFDDNIKKNIAGEILRVLKPGGMILWYDYFIDNPKNSDVKSVGKKELHLLFPHCDFLIKRVTLAPPLSRKLTRLSYILCEILEKIPFLCTHYHGVIRKRT